MAKQQLPEQHASDSDTADEENDVLPPFFGLSGPVLMGLAAWTGQLERCPRASRILERLAYAALVCTVLVTWIKYGHG